MYCVMLGVMRASAPFVYRRYDVVSGMYNINHALPTVYGGGERGKTDRLKLPV